MNRKDGWPGSITGHPSFYLTFVQLKDLLGVFFVVQGCFAALNNKKTPYPELT